MCVFCQACSSALRGVHRTCCSPSKDHGLLCSTEEKEVQLQHLASPLLITGGLACAWCSSLLPQVSVAKKKRCLRPARAYVVR